MAGVADLEQHLNNPRVRAFLEMIADAEGTNKYSNPYAVAGGGKVTLQDLSRANFPMWGFTQTDGKRNQSSAAGKFQFLQSTWDGLNNQYNFGDFGERSQTLGAIALLKQNGALPYVLAGDWQKAIAKAGPTWASLPSSTYKQGKRSMEFVQKSLSKHLGAPIADLQPMQPQSGYVGAGYVKQADAPALKFAEIATEEKSDPYQALFNPTKEQQPSVVQQEQADYWGVNNLSNVARDYGKVAFNYLE